MSTDPANPARRLRIAARGAVQGVGFRPFVFRLATELGLAGWVNNSAQGVLLEVEGDPAALQQFLNRFEPERPPRSFLQSLEAKWLDPAGYQKFEIRPSDDQGQVSAFILPDIATCPKCVAEIFNTKNRRFLYPFTNCTHCGPRFSIIEALPYDRSRTSMSRFAMCPLCQAEYEDPENRRFHAQPNACPVCGPHLELWNSEGRPIARSREARPGKQGRGHGSGANSEALAAAAHALSSGRIVAVKGLGGFHFMVRADAPEAVERLRLRKRRGQKPLAVMFKSVAMTRRWCQVSEAEARLLSSPEAPIVLLRRLATPEALALSDLVAPANPNIGVLLPYTPLHHLLLDRLEGPLVATSGNLADEPICISEQEALERLRGVADFFLVHNRPIVRHVDDSIVRVVADRELVLRRARGFAPLPITLPEPGRSGFFHSNSFAAKASSSEKSGNGLAVGGQLKSAVALAIGPQIFISQHLGDLETVQAYDAFCRAGQDLQQLYHAPAGWLAADLHPDYRSTRFAESTGRPCMRVQHHVAHVLSCMAENEVQPPALGIAWDGTGFGTDGSVWGGEFFRISDTGYERLAHLRSFPLPGGEAAVREPRRSALGLLFAAFGESVFDRHDLVPLKSFSSAEQRALRAMLRRQVNSPMTSSIGRLFDALASILDLRHSVDFEGQAAMDLEFLLPEIPPNEFYELALLQAGPVAILDWQLCVQGILADLSQGLAKSSISAKFHNSLVEALVRTARWIGLERVVLSGGCFQNRYLVEHTFDRLAQAGFRPYGHQRVPPNDGGICLGQVVAARWWNV